MCILDAHMGTVVVRSEDTRILHTGASPPLFVTEEQEINAVRKTSYYNDIFTVIYKATIGLY